VVQAWCCSLLPAPLSQASGPPGKRGNLSLPRLGAHRLRHTLATGLLRAGAPLAEVGQVLRHRSQLSTAVYANPRELHQTGENLQVAC